jgi:alkanesulfonate monooxygenase SsuD/methylene tetrahydromethanopterin reductase-like flavin-dependent oxidoreductase (luciferase family)
VAASEVKLGVLLPTRGLLMTGETPRNAESILSMAEEAEEAGLDSVWVGDSLTAKPRLEPLTTLAAVAARTRRVRLGTAVMLAALRHPVLMSHVVGTLDLIAGGRTVLAIGVGGAFNDAQQREWRAAGVDASRRAGRLSELVEIAKRLGAGETVSFAGRHFDLDEVSMEPRPPQDGGVPVLLACHWRAASEAQVRRAARLGDGFIGISDTPGEYAMVADKVRAYRAEYGRDSEPMESAFYMTVNLDPDEERAAREADRYLMLYYGANIWGDRWGPFGGPAERTVERIRQYADAGAGTIIVRFASFDQERQMDTFLNEVAPAFG